MVPKMIAPVLRNRSAIAARFRRPPYRPLGIAPVENRRARANRATISAGSGSTWWPHVWHHTIRRTRAAAALPSVIGGPGGVFMSVGL